jgi:dTMP kinase
MGKLIVIEGNDGSGKETQSKLLYDKLKKEGKKVKLISFPDYKSNSSALVKMYLGGDFGNNPKNVNVYAASTFYAVDRFASYTSNWKDFYDKGGTVICDRYTTANMLHQAATLDTEKEKEKYLNWLEDLEFNLYKLPKPDIVVFLKVIPEKTLEIIKERKNKITNKEEKDIFEREESIRMSFNNALHVADKYNWATIDCVKNNNLRKIEDIHEEIMEKIKKI